MIRLLAAAKNFNQLFLENALKKMFEIGTTEDNYMNYNPINSFKNECLDFLQNMEKVKIAMTSPCCYGYVDLEKNPTFLNFKLYPTNRYNSISC